VEKAPILLQGAATVAEAQRGKRRHRTDFNLLKQHGFQPVGTNSALLTNHQAMMDPAVKIALALCVLLAGMCASLMFRNNQPGPTPLVANLDEPSLPDDRSDALAIRSRAIRRAAPVDDREPQSAPSDVPSATVVTPMDRHEPPPSLSSEYPAAERKAGSRWGASMEMMLPVVKPADESAGTHRVVDGDTLAALAERYLGSADRADDLYQANRDVLQSPRLLPIGAELKIPPRRR
jgi:nucleoid-associated protein YgaU